MNLPRYAGPQPEPPGTTPPGTTPPTPPTPPAPPRPALVVEGSLLACDLAAIGTETQRISPHITALHLDASDGGMVEQPLLAPAILVALRPHLDCLVHVHLMAYSAERLAMQWAEAGADVITVHVEADDTGQVLHRLHQDAPRVRAGVALSREVDVADVEYYLDYAHLILIANTPLDEPEAGLDRYARERVHRLRGRIERRRPGLPLLVEGAVHIETVAQLAADGATGVVAGSLLAVAPDDVAARAAWIAGGGRGRPPALTRMPAPGPTPGPPR